ncbi:MAG: stage V sporulation protein AD [Lachnospiraceae bacterium]|nr:stage V sporulation protein AD [Lachnospiraceae bacterium]
MNGNHEDRKVPAQALGKQSIRFINPVYCIGSASVVGKKEGEGPLRDLFDVILEDDMNGCNSWEEAESTLQRDAVSTLLQKSEIRSENVRYLFGGDLLGQSIASTFGLLSFEIPYIGLYGACSTCGLSLSMGSMAVAGGFAENVICVTSSHFASAEKEFRFPLSYGNQRPLSATWTVTGSGAFLLSSSKKTGVHAAITGITTGKIVDYGLKDSMNMGACMAPAAADTILQHMKDFHAKPADYDKIITGDLGEVGKTALQDLLLQKDIDISEQYMDCGIEIFDDDTQDTHSGGSGCGCSAVVLSALILRQIERGIWKKVLFVPTGALLSKTSFNEGKSVPGIAHAVVIESC